MKKFGWAERGGGICSSRRVTKYKKDFPASFWKIFHFYTTAYFILENMNHIIGPSVGERVYFV